MKAVFCTKYGTPEVLKIREAKKPVPKKDEVLIKIHGTTVTMGDCEIRRFKMPIFLWIPIRLFLGITKPRQPIIGAEMAGEIESVGSMVTNYKVGDQVFGTTGMTLGAYAQYTCQKADFGLMFKPVNMNYQEAATIPVGGLNGLHFIRKAGVKKGDKVLINGAGGSIGTYALQLAKHYGAEVHAVDRAEKLEMLRSLGADRVIDYQKEDFTRQKENYDVIIDVVCRGSYSKAVKTLSKRGRYVLGNPTMIKMLRGFWTSLVSGKKVYSQLADEKTEDLKYLKDLVEQGVLKSVIDKSFSLEQMAEAHKYVETGMKTGNVVVSVSHE